MKQVLEKIIHHVPKQFVIPGVLGIIGLFFLGYGLIQYFQSVPSRENSNQPQVFTGSVISPPKNYGTISPTVVVKPIILDIEGAVQNPGVYSLAVNSRVKDALITAGGLSVNADRIFIEQQINLAAKVTDGGKIYIPRLGEKTVVGQSPLAQLTQGVLGENVSGLIPINSAAAADLVGLKGIGTVTAQKIISGRPYTSIQELLSRKIVSQKVFDEIKDKITAE